MGREKIEQGLVTQLRARTVQPRANKMYNDVLIFMRSFQVRSRSSYAVGEGISIRFFEG